MNFFKPTLWKILLVIVILLLWGVWMVFATSFFGCSLIAYNVPNPHGHGEIISGTPYYLSPIEQIVLGAIGYLFLPGLWCLELSKYYMLSFIVAVILSIVLSYCISSAVIFLIFKIRKRKGKEKKK